MQPLEPRPDPVALELLRRMTEPADVASGLTEQRLDMTQVDGLILGDLWTAAHSIELWNDGRPAESLAANTARELLALGRTRTPTFRGAACRDYLEFLARKAEMGAGHLSNLQETALWSDACFALSCCADLAFADLAIAARHMLAASGRWIFPHTALVLARLVGPAFAQQTVEKIAGDCIASPLLVAELRVAVQLDLAKHIELASAICDARTKGAPNHEPPSLLADESGYARFAEAGLCSAAKRVRSIHDGDVAYAADEAFTLGDSAVIARLARVGLARDEPWMPAVLNDLLRMVSIAPTAAKTLPSQSAAIALGHAIEAFPTPEAVTTLREVVRATRHAGVKKKLERNLRGAERRLPRRPEIAFRLTAGEASKAASRATLIRSLEASFGSGFVLREDAWRALVTEQSPARSVVTRLVWRLPGAHGTSQSVLPIVLDNRLILADVNGSSVIEVSGWPATLWHPADVSAEERTAWRNRITALRMEQPFRQVFREHYEIPPRDRIGYETGLFADYVISGTPFVGLARREGWRLREGSIERSFACWTARFALTDTLHPGFPGKARTKTLSFWTAGEGVPRPVPLGGLPPAIVSEALRAVDLLVSTSAFGIEEAHDDPQRERRLDRLAQQTFGAAADMRKQAIRCALRGLDGMADAIFGTRHLHLGPYAIHLATGRITCGGEPVPSRRPPHSNLHAVPWLPYYEKLLELIVHAAVDIAAKREEDSSPEAESSTS